MTSVTDAADVTVNGDDASRRAGTATAVPQPAASVPSSSVVPTDEPFPPEVVFRVEDLNCYYGAHRAVRDVTMDISRTGDHRHHRALGVRQDDCAALLQPHERPDRRSAGGGHACCSGAWICTTRGSIPCRGAAPRRHGVPETEPVPEVRVRQRGLRSPHRRSGPPRANCPEIVEASLRRAALFDEVKDRLKDSAIGTVGWPAAAPLHRASHRHQPGRPADGRALLGTGSRSPRRTSRNSCTPSRRSTRS